MHILCFEDDAVRDLSPIVLARPAYAIGCASFRLVDWLRELAKHHSQCRLFGVVRPHLREVQRLDYQLESFEDSRGKAAKPDGVLLVNARLVPSVAMFEQLQSLVQETRCTMIAATPTQGEAFDDTEIAPEIVAAWLPRVDVDAASAQAAGWQGWWQYAIQSGHRAAATLDVFRWPHDVVAHHMRNMATSVAWRVQHGDYEQWQDGLFVGEGVSIGQYLAAPTDGGAIILENNVRVGPFCLLAGPIYAGANTRIIEHSALKDGVALGHTVKIGGEVEASVIEPYSNKQHHGFLGHSYLGSWINLGAGTCNSDLKNTYGRINIEYGDRKVATGMQFLGCLMGDYSKSAINTGIFTGKVIGVCSMLYGFVTSNVPSYVNYARLFGQTSLLPPEVMINTQARMFARRKVEQRPCDIELIEAMYELTENERQISEQIGL